MTDAFRDAYCDEPPAPVVARAAGIRLLALDVDGVLTDGSVFTGAEGETLKRFHIHDGKGIAMLRAAGVGVAVLTARRSPAVRRRAGELGIDPVCQGVRDKAATLAGIAADRGLEMTACAWVGDDLVDLAAARLAGLAVAVADAHPRLARACHWQTARAGGRGAVREVCELILAAQGRLQPSLDAHG
ncbi:KdsC family phosphatase [Spiribacter halobius]|uniref:3-deoxy-D-manno-octulosonate 8-phosphate phosphatase KdsC n=1 Tax=Sediminicurvatus halobius TaxID=2182432 RepID=A0A2U2N7Z1_9GAMM|nr:HAD hydrolase family protein [Spiribacter halobius]PWG65203.1 phenylphosphate carboxylase subunit delta [Spiribacter halobius]UEX78843.1 HAD hydrolase family protein [Spiribacter halobius]